MDRYFIHHTKYRLLSWAYVGKAFPSQRETATFMFVQFLWFLKFHTKTLNFNKAFLAQSRSSLTKVQHQGCHHNQYQTIPGRLCTSVPCILIIWPPNSSRLHIHKWAPQQSTVLHACWYLFSEGAQRLCVYAHTYTYRVGEVFSLSPVQRPTKKWQFQWW